jgi:hypothetical protein
MERNSSREKMMEARMASPVKLYTVVRANVSVQRRPY